MMFCPRRLANAVMQRLINLVFLPHARLLSRVWHSDRFPLRGTPAGGRIIQESTPMTKIPSALGVGEKRVSISAVGAVYAALPPPPALAGPCPPLPRSARPPLPLLCVPPPPPAPPRATPRCPPVPLASPRGRRPHCSDRVAGAASSPHNRAARPSERPPTQLISPLAGYSTVRRQFRRGLVERKEAPSRSWSNRLSVGKRCARKRRGARLNAADTTLSHLDQRACHLHAPGAHLPPIQNRGGCSPTPPDQSPSSAPPARHLLATGHGQRSTATRLSRPSLW
jgi:hypothetical protein